MRKLFCLVLAFASHGQDQRFFEELKFSNGVDKKEIKGKGYTWKTWGKVLRYDLNGDNSPEGLQMVKKDHEDWFYIRDNGGYVLAKYRLESKGRESGGYRIKINDLGKNLRLLSLYFYDGFTEYNEFYGTASIYFIAFKINNLDTMKFSKGPSIWLEQKKRGHYRQRDYTVRMEDLDRDGIKELIVSHQHIQRIFRYSSKKGMRSISL